MKRLMQLLNQVLTNDKYLIKELDCILEEERSLILTEFNDTHVDYPKDKTVVELFEEQVEKTPDDIAVVFEEESLTYKELNEKANMLADHLRGLGVRADDHVAIMSEKSIEMIVGILGIIKSGGAYIPLDPTQPKGRINYILEDCHPKALLMNDRIELELEQEVPIISLMGYDVLKLERPKIQNVLINQVI